MATFFLVFTLIVYIINLFLYLRAWFEHKPNKIYNTTSYQPKITILVPAFNEEVSIIDSIKSMRNQTYSNFDIIIINDGSTDKTVAKIVKEFKLTLCYLEPKRNTDNYKSVGKIYCGIGITLLDKQNGGKGCALNAGFAYTDAEYILSVDGDTILVKDCLKTLIAKKKPNADAIASMIGIANGIKDINNPTVPQGFWSKVQWLEYLRGYTLLRDSTIDKNCVTVISGACSLIKSEMLLKTNGYKHNHLGEDMENSLNIHRQGGTIQYLNEILSYTEVPDNIKDLSRQRVRWFRGGLRSYLEYKDLLFNRKNKFFGFFLLPYIWVTSIAMPYIIVSSIIFTVYGYINDSITYSPTLLVITLILHFCNSLFALMYIKFKLKLYDNYKGILFINLIEGFTFHFIFIYWALKAHILEMFGAKKNWNKLSRKGF